MRIRVFAAILLAAAVVGTTMIESTSAGATPVRVAQTSHPVIPPAQPGRVQRLREKTKESWTQMKRRWSMQREKYSSCRREARAQRLAGRKTRQFLEECMGR